MLSTQANNNDKKTKPTQTIGTMKVNTHMVTKQAAKITTLYPSKLLATTIVVYFCTATPLIMATKTKSKVKLMLKEVIRLFIVRTKPTPKSIL